jgi:hypothetical protein
VGMCMFHALPTALIHRSNVMAAIHVNVITIHHAHP